MNLTITWEIAIAFATLVGLAFGFGRYLWSKQDKVKCDAHNNTLQTLEKNVAILTTKLELQMQNFQVQHEAMVRQIEALSHSIHILERLNEIEKFMKKEA